MLVHSAGSLRMNNDAARAKLPALAAASQLVTRDSATTLNSHARAHDGGSPIMDSIGTPRRWAFLSWRVRQMV